ncbi:MAG: protoheme IX farnesyltransferase [Chloroflexi bacterium]|nr:protoheme IX farnesyltransferase [Chloroflexota bacterium]
MLIQAFPFAGHLRDYIALTKPRIISLLLVTAIAGMVVAAQGWPDPITLLLVTLCGYLAAGGANSLNHGAERDLDRSMRRTSRRPVASGRVPPRHAIGFGIILNVLAFAILATFLNLLTAVLALSGTLIYLFVYTFGLKRITPQNIVIGGAAGAVPPLVGWAAVTGSLELPALVLFAIIFIWTPPHFWALALLIKDDYARAGLPMLPVVAGPAATKRQILIYTFVLVGVAIAFAFTGVVGSMYLVIASASGAGFLVLALRLARSEGIEGAKSLYLYSIAYLAAVFLGAMLDVLAGGFLAA